MNEENKLDIESWQPKTSVGKQVKNGEIKDIDVLLDKGMKILEAEIVDVLLPDLENDLLFIGQSRGKFGGGQRRVFKQTQKKTKEGNKPRFSTTAVVGNKNGYIGVGTGKSKETVPAREKAIRNAKLGVFKIRRGCGSWQCNCGEAHTIPYEVEGSCGSVRIKLKPAPKGKGLVVQSELQKVLALAGIKDVWSKAHGQTGTRINMISACEDALRKLVSTKVKTDVVEAAGIKDGKIVTKEE